MSKQPKHRAEPGRYGPIGETIARKLEHPAAPMILRRAIVILAALTVVTLIAFALTACSPATGRDATPEEAGGAMSQAQSDEALAREVAIGMDSRFSDDEVWHYAKESASAFCDLADDGGIEFAKAASLVIAEDSGVDAQSIGIVWGIGTTLYCPEYELE